MINDEKLNEWIAKREIKITELKADYKKKHEDLDLEEKGKIAIEQAKIDTANELREDLVEANPDPLKPNPNAL